MSTTPSITPTGYYAYVKDDDSSLCYGYGPTPDKAIHDAVDYLADQMPYGAWHPVRYADCYTRPTTLGAGEWERAVPALVEGLGEVMVSPEEAAALAA